MKLLYKNLILFCSLVSVLTSCDLDVVPPAEISAEKFLENGEGCVVCIEWLLSIYACCGYLG